VNVAVQVPIKGRKSTRVPNKNFRELGGKPLSWWLLDRLVESAPPEWDLYVDSECDTVWERLRDRYAHRVSFFKRHPWFASDEANGNHLIHQFAVQRPQYDVYAQIHVTAVTLSGEIIVESIQSLLSQLDRYDSLLLVTQVVGWFWHQGKAVNYHPDKPNGLPRSQDAPMFQETTGLYASTRDSIYRTGCRIGAAPLFYEVPPKYAFDIDTMEDFQEAEQMFGSPSNVVPANANDSRP
jgi:CMP-N-acetylneuraminic acid synthetase